MCQSSIYRFVLLCKGREVTVLMPNKVLQKPILPIKETNIEVTEHQQYTTGEVNRSCYKSLLKNRSC
jgi:hypothetical protein